MNEKSYHHGDLAQELRHVAVDLIAERGAAGFSLREVARRAGVSHAAPAHHYGDATGLLTAIAIEAFVHLEAAIRLGAEGLEDPVDRLAAMARAYVEVSRSSPGHCAIVFRKDLVDGDNADYQAAGSAAYGIFHDAVADVAAALNPSLDVDNATRLGWATMQGLVELHPNMVAMAETDGLSPAPQLGDLAEIMARMMVDGMRAST